MEDAILDIMYQIPSEKNIKSCTITEEVIYKKEIPKLERFKN